MHVLLHCPNPNNLFFVQITVNQHTNRLINLKCSYLGAKTDRDQCGMRIAWFRVQISLWIIWPETEPNWRSTRNAKSLWEISPHQLEDLEGLDTTNSAGAILARLDKARLNSHQWWRQCHTQSYKRCNSTRNKIQGKQIDARLCSKHMHIDAHIQNARNTKGCTRHSHHPFSKHNMQSYRDWRINNLQCCHGISRAPISQRLKIFIEKFLNYHP